MQRRSVGRTNHVGEGRFWSDTSVSSLILGDRVRREEAPITSCPDPWAGDSYYSITAIIVNAPGPQWRYVPLLSAGHYVTVMMQVSTST